MKPARSRFDLNVTSNAPVPSEVDCSTCDGLTDAPPTLVLNGTSNLSPWKPTPCSTIACMPSDAGAAAMSSAAAGGGVEPPGAAADVRVLAAADRVERCRRERTSRTAAGTGHGRPEDQRVEVGERRRVVPLRVGRGTACRPAATAERRSRRTASRPTPPATSSRWRRTPTRCCRAGRAGRCDASARPPNVSEPVRLPCRVLRRWHPTVTAIGTTILSVPFEARARRRTCRTACRSGRSSSP